MNEDCYFFPGTHNSVLSVGSVKYDPFKKNVTFLKYSARNKEVDLCAHGDRVYSCLIGNKYGTMSGTSMAGLILHNKIYKRPMLPDWQLCFVRKFYTMQNRIYLSMKKTKVLLYIILNSLIKSFSKV